MQEMSNKLKEELKSQPQDLVGKAFSDETWIIYFMESGRYALIQANPSGRDVEITVGSEIIHYYADRIAAGEMKEFPVAEFRDALFSITKKIRDDFDRADELNNPPSDPFGDEGQTVGGLS